MGIDSIIKITRRQLGKIARLGSGKAHKVQVKTGFSGHVLEVGDVHFHHDSAVFLPDFDEEPGGEKKPTSFDIIDACYLHAREHPEQSTLIVGHTDRSGDATYNLALSKLRASNVLFIAQGKRAEWVQVTLQKNKVEDYQQILIWLSRKRGWNCDPGSKTNVHDAATRAAVRQFQEQFNTRFAAGIAVTGNVTAEAWGAFFDVYMSELRDALGTNEDGFKEARAFMRFLPCEAIGCGEEFPITEDRKENYRSPVDRRVEILFFDPGEEPETDCTAPRGACTELYTKKMYRFKPVPIRPGGLGVHVVLQLLYKDPDGTTADHPLPKGMEVTIEYGNGTPEKRPLAANGMLDFFAPREKLSFTLRFQFTEVFYLASPPPDVGGPDVLIREAQVEDFHTNRHHRLFKLPLDWRLADSDWTVTGASTYDPAAHLFKKLDDRSVNAIGSGGAPAKAVLNPHWQFLKLTYFDRFVKSKLSIPPVIVEGFRQAPAGAATPPPDARSNWAIRADGLQCLPWILQKPAAKPDRQVMLQFRAPANSHVVTTDADNRVIEAVTDLARLAPGPERLKLYDLPELWKSSNYFARRSNGVGDFFQNLTDAQVLESIVKATPLSFSLDDIVLTGANLVQRPILATDKVILFSHLFSDKDSAGTAVPNLSPEGLYKPVASPAGQPVFPFSDIAMPVLHYISDYPDWTRLAIAQGNPFDVFNKRTPAVAGNSVVGARAAVLWTDAVGAGVAPTSELNPRPGRVDSDPDVRKRFFSVQPFFAQDMHRVRGRDLSTGVYREWQTPVPSFPGWVTGRFDMLLLRCCDVVNGEEIAINMQFFRFHIDYTSAPATNADGTPFNRDTFKQKMLANLPKRWNGPDAGHGTGVPAARFAFSYAPQDPAGPKLRVRPFWFVQDVPQPRAHFRINVVSIDRANMNGSDGIGNFGRGNEESIVGGSFTAAHELGHGGSLPDEYNERWSACSYEAQGFGCQFPGDPFSQGPSGPLMFEGTRDIFSRYFWHAAEWTRLVTGVPLHIENVRNGSTLKYKVFAHPNAGRRNFTHYPLIVESNASVAPRGRFDLHLYQLGADGYGSSIAAPGTTFDGLLIVLVKLRFNFVDATAHAHIVEALNSVRASVGAMFNRFELSGDVVDSGGTAIGVRLTKCRVLFLPRFLVPKLVIELGNPDNANYLRGLGYAVNTGVVPATTTATQADYTTKVAAIETEHPRHFLVNVNKAAVSGWANATDLNIALDVATPARHTLGARFQAFFGDMVGLNLSTAVAPNNVPTAATVQSRIARRIIPSATVT